MWDDTWGFQCICGDYVAVMHTECRSLMDQYTYDRWTDRANGRK